MLPYVARLTHADQNKPVTAIRGVDVFFAKRLQEAGYNFAHELLGPYLYLNKDRGRFTDWMRLKFGATRKEAAECYQWLEEWYMPYL